MPPAPDPPDLADEDRKILVLARAARARTGAAEGAAVRDTDGRTYSGCTVALPSLALSALQVAVAAAAASGARDLEAAAVVTAVGTVDEASVTAVRDLGPRAPVLRAGPSGELADVLRPA